MSSTLYAAETTTGTVTSYIPLTSIWTASPGCESKFRLDGPSLMAYDPAYGLDVETGVICDPPAMTTWWEQGLLGGGGPYVTRASIGPLICPDGWSTVASSTKDSSSVLEMCCPSGYYLSDGIPGEVVGNCLSDVSSGMTLTFGSTAAGDSTSWSMATTTMSSSSTVGAIGVVGWNIKAATTAPSTTMTSTLPTSTTSTSSTSTGPQNTSTSASSSSGSGGDLTTGAKAGIGVGVGVGAIGVIALIVALLLLRRRKQQSPDAPAAAPAPGQPPYTQPPYAQPPYAEPAYTHASSSQSPYDQNSSSQPAYTQSSSSQTAHTPGQTGVSEAGWSDQHNFLAELDGNRRSIYAGIKPPVELESTGGSVTTGENTLPRQ